MNHRLTVFFALALASCGPAQQEEAKDPAQAKPVTEQLRITNINQSDLAVCFPKAPAVPDKITAETLTGLLVAARPQVMECLADPVRRGPAKETRVVIKSTLGASGVEHAVSGQNVTPEGEKCITSNLSRFFSTVPQLATPAAGAWVVCASPASAGSAAPAIAKANASPSNARAGAGISRTAVATMIFILIGPLLVTRHGFDAEPARPG